MPSLIDIRRRVRSVRNTQQITKAMKMVSAAKLRRAQDRVIAARPYAESMQRMLANVAQAASEEEASRIPLLAQRPEKRIQLIVMTADASMFLTGPGVVREALGEEISASDLGGPHVHERNGLWCL